MISAFNIKRRRKSRLVQNLRDLPPSLRSLATANGRPPRPLRNWCGVARCVALATGPIDVSTMTPLLTTRMCTCAKAGNLPLTALTPPRSSQRALIPTPNVSSIVALSPIRIPLTPRLPDPPAHIDLDVPSTPPMRMRYGPESAILANRSRASDVFAPSSSRHDRPHSAHGARVRLDHSPPIRTAAHQIRMGRTSVIHVNPALGALPPRLARLRPSQRVANLSQR